MKIPFGKYKNSNISSIYKTDPTYIEWLYKNVDSEEIRMECYELLFPKSIGKVEDIISESLIYRGYSETESNVFIRRLKNTKV